MTIAHCLMVSLQMLWYDMKQGGYFICFPAHQYSCSDPHRGESHFPSSTCLLGWSWFQRSSDRWLSWMSVPLRALWPLRLVQGLMSVLEAPKVELCGSLKGSEAQNSVSAMDTTPILHQYSWDSHSVPYSPTLQGYSPTKLTAATP